MKRFLLLTAAVFLSGCGVAVQDNSTFCNPLNLDYKFREEEPCRREAADPVMVLFDGEYYLFVSKAGGYWHSRDFREWKLVETRDLPLEDYAPAVFVMDGRMYYTAFNTKQIFVTADPKSEVWKKAADINGYRDPALFLDDDGRVYMYSGCAYIGTIEVVELDAKNGFKEIGKPVICLASDYEKRGWERPGDDNLGVSDRVGPWIEGAWMTKHGGKYYLQYSAPGTKWKSYADGVFVSDNPKGPFSYAEYSPFSHKPTGFICSGGHGCTFQDSAGNYWRVVTMVISVAHRFERRLGVFPAGFDKDGQMFTNTYLGDYPQFLPGVTKTPAENNLIDWMLLSGGKKAGASSAIANHPAENAFDEEVRTYWSAATGEKGEWLSVDLGKICRINAVQVNFAEEGVRAFGRSSELYQQYAIEVSVDGKNWSMAVDKSSNKLDVPHDYIQLKEPVNARYMKLANVKFPAGGKFSVRDLRVFGNGLGEKPDAVEEFDVESDTADQTRANISWKAAKGASGYIVRYGIKPDKLYNNYQTSGESIGINSLNAGVEYYFTVDSFNENGVTKGSLVK